jgi:iron complex transport system permease protein
MITTILILALSLWRNCGRETIILAGVALSALFVAATTLLQYLADDTQLAAIVHWSFGDVGRADWGDLRLLASVTVIGLVALWSQRRSYNAMMCGNDTATSLGLHVTRLRLTGVTLVALMTATTVTLLGVISFIGLVAPHLVRLLIGDNVVARLPFCALTGAILLLLADVLGRTLLAPLTFPAGVVTAFLGAPLFLALLFSRNQP